MARRGTFGRMPRPAQNLTNTVIAIAREMEAQRDQNIMNAWMKGGLFEGKKVTDELVVAHWKNRAAAVDDDDPLYDMYQNAALEYEYAIAESKTTLALAQGKISPQTAAAFYTKWSNKVPKNSEFWRILQRDAAQLLRQVRAQSDADRKRKEEERYQGQLTSIYDTKIKAGEYLTDVFTQIARRGLQRGGGEALVDRNDGQLTQFAPDDVSRFVQLISGMGEKAAVVNETGAKELNPLAGKAGRAVLFHTDDGVPVTGQSVMQELAKIDPKFSGVVSMDTFSDYLATVQEGLNESIALAEKTGHNSDAKQFADQKKWVAEVRRQAAAYPVEQSYLDSHTDMLRVLNDPKSSAQDRVDAITEHRENAERFASDPRVATNDTFRNKMLGEANGKGEVVSAYDDFTGNLGSDANTNNISRQNMALQSAQYDIDVVANGGLWTTGERDKNGVFSPSAGGSVIGAASWQDIANNSGGIKPEALVMTDKAGRPSTVAVMGQPISVLAIDPTTGGALQPDKGTNPVIGTMYVVGDRRLVQYKDGKGNTLVSDLRDAPWGASAALTEDAKGFTLTINAPTSQDGLANSGFKVVADGRGKQALVYDPYTAALATDPEHWSEIKTGGDPNTDFRSINIAYYATDPSKSREFSALQNNAMFKNAVEEQTRVNTGMVPTAYDPTGRPVAWAGDAREYDRSSAQNGRAFRGEDLGAGWNRETPASELLPGRDEQRGGLYNADSPMFFNTELRFKPLATSNAKDTRFKPLGEYFAPGTLQPGPKKEDAAPGATVKTGQYPLVLPQAPASALPTLGAAGSTNVQYPLTPTPAPTGVTFGGFSLPTGSTSGGTGYNGTFGSTKNEVL